MTTVRIGPTHGPAALAAADPWPAVPAGADPWPAVPAGADPWPAVPAGADPWPAIAEAVRRWLADAKIDARDTILLVPFAVLLPLARRAFATSGGWMPRLETTLTLAAALGPPPPSDGVQVTFDPTVDLLLAARLLRSQTDARSSEQRDPRGFERAAASMVETTYALLAGASALAPASREAHWALARQRLAPLPGPGGRERLLARLALEWAALASPPSTDRLFALRPAAWVAVRAGGAEPLVDRLLAAADGPSLLIDTDPADATPFEWLDPAGPPPTVAVCDGFEQEAQATAAQIVHHVRQGQTPVALIAQDRLLVRRVRALLERDAVVIQDETGWRLSTTRAAALVMALLRAARPDAPADAWLDWLKALPGRDARFTFALDAFEAQLRRHGLASVAAIERHLQALADPASADAPWARLGALAAGVLTPLREAPRQSLTGWITACRRALERCEAWPALESDDAGRQVIAALRLDADLAGEGAWTDLAGELVMTLAGFADWADGALERATFTPRGDSAAAAEVVITPLPRAMLRPFAAVVLPGADAARLGRFAPVQSLIGDSEAQSFGLPDAARRRREELLAFGQVLRMPRLTLLRRSQDGAEPMAESPLIARLRLALASRGMTCAPWQDPRVARLVVATPLPPTAPRVSADWLPAELSASACEALRACPYRFFALNLLRLREPDELDREVEKRDYGTWLHAVLHTFHRGRVAPAGAEQETANLLHLAEAALQPYRVSGADFVPFLASFAAFAPRYVAWLHDRDAAGWRWSDGELEVTLEPEGMGGTRLRGILDRLDIGQRDGTAVVELIDYKTGSAGGLRARVHEPFEDTQLAFYAALLGGTAPLQAGYLALDEAKKIEAVPHPDVQSSAAALLAGLADDWRRIGLGAPLPALGVGEACVHCKARGVCRRDHWSVDEATP